MRRDAGARRSLGGEEDKLCEALVPGEGPREREAVEAEGRGEISGPTAGRSFLSFTGSLARDYRDVFNELQPPGQHGLSLSLSLSLCPGASMP